MEGAPVVSQSLFTPLLFFLVPLGLKLLKTRGF